MSATSAQRSFGSRSLADAHPNSLYCTVINRDKETKARYREWLRQITGDTAAVNRWHRESMAEPRRG